MGSSTLAGTDRRSPILSRVDRAPYRAFRNARASAQTGRGPRNGYHWRSRHFSLDSVRLNFVYANLWMQEVHACLREPRQHILFRRCHI